MAGGMGPTKKVGFEANLFGAFECKVGGAPIPKLRSKKSKWVLAILILKAPREVDRNWLAGVLWPESDEAHARSALRTSLKDVRRCLECEAWRLHTGTDYAVSIDLTGARVDLADFDRAVETRNYQVATDLYRGPLLEGCYEEWLMPEQTRREVEALDALDNAAMLSLEGNDPAGALSFARRALAIDPYRESSVRFVLRALNEQGNWTAAEREFERFKDLLSGDLATLPSIETRELVFGSVSKNTNAANPGAKKLQASATVRKYFDGDEQTCVQPQDYLECVKYLKNALQSLENEDDPAVCVDILKLANQCAVTWHRTGTHVGDWGLLSKARSLTARFVTDDVKSSDECQNRLRRARARAVRMQAFLDEQTGKPMRAIANLQLGLRELKNVGHAREEAMCYCGLAITYLSLNDADSLIENATKGADLGRKIRDRHVLSTAHTFLGHAYATKSEMLIAEKHYRLANIHAIHDDNLMRSSAALIGIARCRLEKNDIVGAARAAQRGVDGLARSGFFLPIPGGLRVLARCFGEMDYAENAVRILVAADQVDHLISRSHHVTLGKTNAPQWAASADDYARLYGEASDLTLEQVFDLVRRTCQEVSILSRDSNLLTK